MARGALGDAWAWVFVDSIQRVEGRVNGDRWIDALGRLGDVVWVEWAGAPRGELRCRWEAKGTSRDLVPDATPAPRHFDFGAEDVRAMRALLASGPMGVDPERLPDWLVRRYESGEVQIRLVPIVFDGRGCFPDHEDA